MNGRRSGWDVVNEWTIRGGFMLAGAHLGLPGLGAIAGAALRHGQAFASETLSIVLNPDETPEMARVRIEDELAAQGITADDASWLFDEQTGEFEFHAAGRSGGGGERHSGRHREFYRGYRVGYLVKKQRVHGGLCGHSIPFDLTDQTSSAALVSAPTHRLIVVPWTPAAASAAEVSG